MTDMSPLPRSLDPLPEESLPGYVLRLAHRLGQSPARILQLTGLAGQLQASRGLMMHLDPPVAGSFARATRLTAAEIAGLCMSSMSGRYPQAAPVIITGRPVTSPWVFTSATRYCPQCLAGDNGSPSSSSTAAPGARHGGCRSCSPARSTAGSWNIYARPAASRPCPPLPEARHT